LVAEAWFPNRPVKGWPRFQCPACGGPPGLVELRKEPSQAEGVTGASRRLMHCPFCCTQWVVPSMKCPACESDNSGDAKFYYTKDEPDLRIDFCKSCNHYVKVVNSGKSTDPLHVGLELLTSSHLDSIAQEKNLRPLEIRA
jgi:FdhE protein